MGICRLVVAMAIFMILLGCTSQASMTNSSDQNETKQVEYVNTSGLSFERTFNSTPSNNVTLEIPEFDFSNITTADGHLVVYYFYMSTCPACIATKPKIDELEARYMEVIFLRYDISTTNGSYAYKDFTEQYGLNKSQMWVPQVLVNGTIITDMFNINESLEGILMAYGG